MPKLYFLFIFLSTYSLASNTNSSTSILSVSKPIVKAVKKNVNIKNRHDYHRHLKQKNKKLQKDKNNK